MNSREQEEWQKQVYDSRREMYRTATLPSEYGPESLLLTYRQHRRMISRLGIKPEHRVLDIGCSFGAWLNWMALVFGCKGVGMDISSEAVAAAKAKNPYGHEFLEGSVEKGLPFPDQSFDRVTCFDVLEHIASPESVLKEVQRVLKPGGQALFHVPVTDIRGSMDWFYSKWNPKKFAEGLKGAGHDYKVMKTREGYAQAAKAAGLEVIYSRRFNAIFQNVFDYHVTHRILNRMFYVWKWPISIYHAAIAPAIETAFVGDVLLQRLDIGASVYLILRKRS